MTDPNDKDGDDLDLDLDLELEPADSDASDESAATAVVEETAAPAPEAVELAPGEAEAVAAAGAADPTQGRWVWQFGAPPPPPSFGARFFGGSALGELYRFFFCGLMVVIGALLPWGLEVDAPATPVVDSAVEAVDGEAAAEATDAVAETILTHVPGFELVAGAFALLLGIYLMYGSAIGIYSGRQRILPIALMIIPAEASWKRFLDAWGSLDGGFLDNITEVFAVTGTGVMVTLLGSTVVVVQFLATIGKVMGKTPEEKEKAAKRAASKGKGKAKDKKAKDDAGGDEAGKGKGGRKRRR